MKHAIIPLIGLLLSPLSAQTVSSNSSTQSSALTGTNTISAPSASVMTIPVDSPAFVFSPGNWIGDEGRGGKLFRQTWNPGAYFRLSWSSANTNPAAGIMLDTSSNQPGINPPKISYNIDGIWQINVPCDKEIPVQGINGRTQRHDLTVILQNSVQAERWGSEALSGANVLRVTSVRIDDGSRPVPSSPGGKWALIIGDSITEGIGTTALNSYSHLLAQALSSLGYEYGISACGYSGWLARGDKPPGDVPAYYAVAGSVNGSGGTYNDAESRWNKIDGNRHSLLDANGKISAYGQTEQAPALILINYGTNDSLRKLSPSDLKASICQGLEALRKSAPDAQIIVLVPFGQYCAGVLKEAVELRRKANPADNKIALIDLGHGVARSLTSKDPKDRSFGDLHPNDRGSANFAALLIPQVMTIMNSSKE